MNSVITFLLVDIVFFHFLGTVCSLERIAFISYFYTTLILIAFLGILERKVYYSDWKRE